MARIKQRTILYRRRREGSTNYNKRLKLLLSKKPRVVVRFTNSRINVQIVDFSPESDKVLFGLNSTVLKKFGWNYSTKNLPAAYLTGLLLGKEAVKRGVKDAILDTGARSPLRQGKMFALIKGLVDAGFNVAHGGDNVYPSDERISGADIKAYAEKLKTEDKAGYDQKFGQYLKSNASPENITTQFEEVKKKILG